MSASSRRDVIGSVAAVLPAAAVSAPILSALEPDAELIAASARYLRLEADYRSRVLSGMHRTGSKATDTFVVDEYGPAIEAIYGLPATTLAGYRAKAAAVYAFYNPDPPDDSAMGDVMWDLVCELAGMPYAKPSDEAGAGKDEPSETPSKGAVA